MNIYIISSASDLGYDSFDSAIVYANSEQEAKNIHPYGDIYPLSDPDNYCGSWGSTNWELTPETVQVEYIGKNANIKESKVILASFNAG